MTVAGWVGYRNRSGRPVSREVWERLVSDERYCLVALDPVGEEGAVETRWTGIYDGAIDALPYVFVTGVRRPGPGGTDRWPDTLLLAVTETEALSHHGALLQRFVAPANCSRSRNFWILPDEVTGNSATKTQ
ncbi:MAG: hypothetical protein ACRDYV_16395 [Acidimicrobiia bacterium]